MEKFISLILRKLFGKTRMKLKEKCKSFFINIFLNLIIYYYKTIQDNSKIMSICEFLYFRNLAKFLKNFLFDILEIIEKNQMKLKEKF